MNLKGETQLPKPAPRQVDPQILAHEIVERLTYRIGKDAKAAKPHDWLHAVILSIRDRVIDAWIESTHKTYEEQGRRVYYLSLEFLIGRMMRDAASNMEMLDDLQAALDSLGVDLDLIAVGDAVLPDAATQDGWRDLPAEEQARIAPDRLILPGQFVRVQLTVGTVEGDGLVYAGTAPQDVLERYRAWRGAW